jgi:sulfoxide reductase heme-binding subunit YedZ
MVMGTRLLIYIRVWILKKIFNEKNIKTWFFILSLVPLILILYKIVFNQLGPEPIKEITHHTGEWTLLFLIFTLSMTPLKKLTNLTIWISFRRMFGLFAFFYASLHLMTYVGLDYRFDLNSISKDVLTKKFIFIGFAAWLLMVPLAITSSKKMMNLLKHNWKKLHKLIYVISIFGVIHFIWLVKKDLTEPLIYLAITILLLAFRVDYKKIFLKVR